MKYVNCPECGHKLMEGEECNNVQVKCTKCGAIIKASITASEVLIKVKDSVKLLFRYRNYYINETTNTDSLENLF